MRTIPREQVLRRVQAENGWWEEPRQIPAHYLRLRRRAYFDLLWPLATDRSIRRAVLLMGPRRVGKTVLIHHTIQKLIDGGCAPSRLCYLSVDHPLYNGCGLQDLLDFYVEAAQVDLAAGGVFVFFDEIQYLKNWEVHLKSLVDSYPGVKFLASGSAAAALRLKSNESGAGRFTDFLLPPLTFYEYLDLLGEAGLVEVDEENEELSKIVDIERLNQSFVHYLNFGGYPEVMFSETIQSDPARFVKGDIIDKVLLRDLPGLYGIEDIQELNHLFTTLAFNTANEVSLEQLSRNSGVAKNTIKRYIEYLEAAFLIKVVHRIDRSSKRFQRANFFKVYLTNPSMRSALFSPIDADDEAIGSLTETAIFAQWFHAGPNLHYARWDNGEVDIVQLNRRQKPSWAVEVKWTDRFAERPGELKSVVQFCHSNGLAEVTVTSRTVRTVQTFEGIEIHFVPASLYCYVVGYNNLRARLPLAATRS
ncbi:MAG TPA: ATP-binding protein [Thermoanaerobaculia bacterium]